jgi:hypothetical protein
LRQSMPLQKNNYSSKLWRWYDCIELTPAAQRKQLPHHIP